MIHIILIAIAVIVVLFLIVVADIRRRFARGLRHFVCDYAPLADRWALWDNLMNPPELRADSRTCTPVELQRMLLP